MICCVSNLNMPNHPGSKIAYLIFVRYCNIYLFLQSIDKTVGDSYLPI